MGILFLSELHGMCPGCSMDVLLANSHDLCAILPRYSLSIIAILLDAKALVVFYFFFLCVCAFSFFVCVFLFFWLFSFSLQLFIS